MPTIAEQYPFTVELITPSGHRFAAASYQTREAAEAGAVAHQAGYPQARTRIVDYSHIPPLEPHCGSWMVTRRATGEVIGEFTNRREVARFNPAVCLVETTAQYLGRINRQPTEETR